MIPYRHWLYREDDGVPRLRMSATSSPATSSAVGVASTDESWPGPSKRKPFEAYDAPTRRLIERFEDLHRLPHGEKVSKRLEEWRWLEAMQGPAERQKFLQPLIEEVRRTPERSEASAIFLMLVCEGLRRGVARQLIAVRSGLDGEMAAPSWHRREEAKRVINIERDRLHDVTRVAVLEALYKYPSPPPRSFFGWMQETVAHRTLDFLKAELDEIQVAPHQRAAGEALQVALHGLSQIEAPDVADRPGFRNWERRIRPLWVNVAQFTEIEGVRFVCRTAVRRLPPRQQDVVNKHYYEGLEPKEIATQEGVSTKTVYASRAQALANLHRDECFFMSLCALNAVRGGARRDALRARYPNGRLPDGRRLVVIDEAA